jgi:2-keto-4-pentenoate hydratase/2-oxohepta-3-ene-1,7-dioic acid hydratase in catechol pathway
LVQYRLPGAPDRAEAVVRIGALAGDTIYDPPRSMGQLTLVEVLAQWGQWVATLRSWSPTRPAPTGAELVSPLTYPAKLLCAGANYHRHLQEMGIPVPDPPGEPFFFLKPPTTTIIGPHAAIPLPDDENSSVDWEAELGVVIAHRCRNLDPTQAPEHIAGYLAANDVSDRGKLSRDDPVAGPFTYDWIAAKGQDGFCPLGPGMVPAWQIPTPDGLAVRCRVNGQLKQDSSTTDMITPVMDLVAAASRLVTLEPGDVLLTGTPAGVGLPRGEFLRPGDEVTVEIDRVGRLTNPVTTNTHAPHRPIPPPAAGEKDPSVNTTEGSHGTRARE